MEKNPYNEFLSIIKETSKSNITENKLLNIGIVVSPLPNLIIKTSEIELDKDNLMIDKWLLDRHKETQTYTKGEHTHSGGGHTTGEGGGDGTHTHTGGEHSHKSKDYVNKLNIGDKVVMLREDDIFYISSLLEGIIKPISKDTQSISQDILTSDFIEEIREILLNVFSYYMLEINFDEYLYSFALHIYGLIKRANSIQSSGNDFLNNIKKNCPFIYDVSVSIAQKLNKKYNISIADSEIGYISIHIGYLIESSNSDSDKVSVLLLCHDYHDINSNIEKKLLDNYQNFITLKLFTTDNSSALINAYSDLIVTTKPLNLIGKEVIVVSPFFTIMDQINVDNAIHKCLENKQKIKRNNMLSSFFDEKLFFKSNNFKNKEDVIRFLGQNVIDYGLCEEGFVESVLEREQLSSTCFFDTFAIPHALDMNATHTMICVLTSESGIQWDDHVLHIVLMLAVQQNDRKKFMELYNGIVQTLEKPEKVNKLVLADNLMDFLNQLLEK